MCVTIHAPESLCFRSISQSCLGCPLRPFLTTTNYAAGVPITFTGQWSTAEARSVAIMLALEGILELAVVGAISQDHRPEGAGRRFLFQLPAESRIKNEIRLGCSGLYPVEFGKPP